jgi:5-methylcytosine-specific restriction endonuclease McrA
MSHVFANLPTLADRGRCAKPKERTRVTDRIADKKTRARTEAQFRAAVWKRDEGKCRTCGRKVKRTLTICAEQGHVHHLRGRNVAPEDRTNPKAAVLLCAVCHQRVHNGTAAKVKR